MDQLEDRLEELQAEVHRVEATSGNPNKFHAEWTIAQVRRAHPGAQEVLARHHLGGCQACAVAGEETLRQGAAYHQADLDRLLVDLEELMGSGNP